MRRLNRSGASLLVLAVCALPAAYGADPERSKKDSCLTAAETAKLQTNSLFAAVKTAIFGPQCDSVKRILIELQSGKQAGGRKLHDKPLDRTKATDELTKAQSDADFNAELAAALEGVTDPAGRKVVEAAVLEKQGYFGARAMLVEDLRLEKTK